MKGAGKPLAGPFRIGPQPVASRAIPNNCWSRLVLATHHSSNADATKKDIPQAGDFSDLQV